MELKATYTAEQMAALEQTEQFKQAKADYDARHGAHDNLAIKRALHKPAPGPALCALEPRDTIIAGLRLPPVKAAHLALLQESGIPFYRLAFESAGTALTFGDIADAIYFFTRTVAEIRALRDASPSDGGTFASRLRAASEPAILDVLSPAQLVAAEHALLEHIASASGTRVELRSAAPEDEQSSHPSAKGSPPMVSAGSSS